MDAKKSDEEEAQESGIKTKIVGILAIAGLIAMAVFVGTAAAEGSAWIDSYKSPSVSTQDFVTTDNVYARGYLGDESEQGHDGGRVYVVAHEGPWINGTPLDDVSGEYEAVTWDVPHVG